MRALSIRSTPRRADLRSLASGASPWRAGAFPGERGLSLASGGFPWRAGAVRPPVTRVPVIRATGGLTAPLAELARFTHRRHQVAAVGDLVAVALLGQE